MRVIVERDAASADAAVSMMSAATRALSFIACPHIDGDEHIYDGHQAADAWRV